MLAAAVSAVLRAYAIRPAFAMHRAETGVAAAPPDTVGPRFKVKRTTIQDEEEPKASIDLKDPENLKTEAEYNEKEDTYRLGTKLGDDYLETPFFMTSEEYMNWSFRRSMSEYYRSKNRDDFKAKGKEKFDFTDMKFNLGPADKIFGPGGVRIKTQGSAELKIGANTRFTDNPSLSDRKSVV